MRNPQHKPSFFIGWSNDRYPGHVKFLRTAVTGFIGFAILTCLAWVWGQRGFVSSVFEYGERSELEGILVMEPVPLLKMPVTNGSVPDQFESVMLVGKGKIGAVPTLDAVANELGTPLDGKPVILGGTLIYYDGKTVLELNEGTDAFVGWSTDEMVWEDRIKVLGDVTFAGEIYDPKCAFGVMKPGYGKPHKSCAVRCLSGGIPAVLKVNQVDSIDYVLLLNNVGAPIGDRVLPFVADRIRVCGQLSKQDDWYQLEIDLADIAKLLPRWALEDLPQCNPHD